MKCPKCSYTSFDYLDACKQCGTDLRDSRTLLQIIAVSPEDRAPATSPAMRADSGTAGAPAAAAAPPEFGESPPASEEGELLEGLDFEESFEGLVERTSYDSAEPGTEAETEAEAGEDELLDLDFGDIFGEEAKKE